MQPDGSLVYYGMPELQLVDAKFPGNARTKNGKEFVAVTWEQWDQSPVKQLDAEGRQVPITAQPSKAFVASKSTSTPKISRI